MFVNNNYSMSFQGTHRIIEKTVSCRLKDNSVSVTKGVFDKKVGGYTSMQTLIYKPYGDKLKIVGGGGLAKSNGLSPEEVKNFHKKSLDLVEGILAIVTKVRD